VQLAWLGAAVFVVSAGYGGLLPLLPDWLAVLKPGAAATNIARQVGFLSAAYAAGVLVGALLWGLVSDHARRSRILVIGMVGFVASELFLLFPGAASLWGLYASRVATGFFVAAVVPVVSALVAEHTPEEKRARRFAWLGAMSLLGFLFGPGLSVAGEWIAPWISQSTPGATLSALIVIVLSAALGAVMMAGLAWTLPASPAPPASAPVTADDPGAKSSLRLWWLSGLVTFVLAGFELGIVLLGKQHDSQSTRQAAFMFAECSLVMLAVNALLFFTALMGKVKSSTLIGAGLVVAAVGLAVLALHRAEAWMFLGVSLTSAGTGLVLPVITYLAAGVSQHKLGVTMGGLAAAGGLGQTLGSSAGGWLFGAFAAGSFGWLALPLGLLLALVMFRPGWLAAVPSSAAEAKRPSLRAGPGSSDRPSR
jgi:MFS family permease